MYSRTSAARRRLLRSNGSIGTLPRGLPIHYTAVMLMLCWHLARRSPCGVARGRRTAYSPPSTSTLTECPAVQLSRSCAGLGDQLNAVEPGERAVFDQHLAV